MGDLYSELLVKKDKTAKDSLLKYGLIVLTVLAVFAGLIITPLALTIAVLIPLPVPASVYGLVIMLIALLTHIIRLDQVKEAAEFLIETMPVMFIPAGVGLLTAWGVLKPVCVPIILIVAITTVVVMIVTGRVTQAVIRMDRKKGQKKS